MKIVIASDIHGSSLYCKQFLNSCRTENADRILLLGDILYHGPRNELPNGYNPKEVIELLNGYDGIITGLRGNCDSEVDQMVLNFPIMSDYTLLLEKNITVFATHGHIYNADNMPKLKSGDILLHGHLHIPKCETLNSGVIYINPGSVSIPKENSQRSYITFENGLFKWKNLQGTTYMEYRI